MPSPDRAEVRFVISLGLLLLPALYSGQTLEAQQPLGAYYEVSGMWCGDYNIDPGRARVAVLAALADMHMPISQEGFFPWGSFLDTKTPDNFEARLTVLPLGRRGAGTQVASASVGLGHTERCAPAFSTKSPGIWMLPGGVRLLRASWFFLPSEE